MLVFVEGARREPTTNSTHIWRRVRELFDMDMEICGYKFSLVLVYSTRVCQIQKKIPDLLDAKKYLESQLYILTFMPPILVNNLYFCSTIIRSQQELPLQIKLLIFQIRIFIVGWYLYILPFKDLQDER